MWFVYLASIAYLFVGFVVVPDLGIRAFKRYPDEHKEFVSGSFWYRWFQLLGFGLLWLPLFIMLEIEIRFGQWMKKQ